MRNILKKKKRLYTQPRSEVYMFIGESAILAGSVDPNIKNQDFNVEAKKYEVESCWYGNTPTFE